MVPVSDVMAGRWAMEPCKPRNSTNMSAAGVSESACPSSIPSPMVEPFDLSSVGTDPEYRVTMTVPALRLLPDPSVETEVNDKIAARFEAEADAFVQAAVEAGTDDFLSKPVNRVELVKRVENMLKLRHVSDELERLRSYISTMDDDQPPR